MSEFFDSLKSDLLDRRLMPVLALLGLALVGAIVYAVMAGGSNATPNATSSPAASSQSRGIAVTALTSAKTATAETTSGTSEQAGGPTRDPFAPVPGVKSATASTSSTSTAGSSSATSGATSGASGSSGSETGSSGSSEGSSGGSEPSGSQNGGTQDQKKQGAKPQKTYKVSVLFGTAPAGTPALTAGLTSYENLQRQQPLPSTKQPLIVFRGVIAGGKSATFTLVGEAIPRGNGVCQPSAAQCQAIDVKVGETEELEYVPLEGTPVNYELYVVKIEAVKTKASGSASTASVGDAFATESKAGLKILRKAGLLALPWLRYSSDGSVLVFKRAGHGFVARAHASAWGTALKG